MSRVALPDGIAEGPDRCRDRLRHERPDVVDRDRRRRRGRGPASSSSCAASPGLGASLDVALRDEGTESLRRAPWRRPAPGSRRARAPRARSSRPGCRPWGSRTRRTWPPAAVERVDELLLATGPSHPSWSPRRRPARCRARRAPSVRMSSSRSSLVARASAPTPVTTASVPPPNMTGVATRSLSCATWAAASIERSAQVPSFQRRPGLPRRAPPRGGATARAADRSSSPQNQASGDVVMRRPPAARPDAGRPSRPAGGHRPGAIPAARQTSASRRPARARTPMPRRVVAALGSPIAIGRRVAAPPRREPLVHRLEALAGPLVGVGHDPFLAASRSPPSGGRPPRRRAG